MKWHHDQCHIDQRFIRFRMPVRRTLGAPVLKVVQ